MDPFPPEPYRSARLLYRAPEDNPADDAFFHALYADPVVGSMATTALLRPLSTKERKELRAKLSDVFMSVMICIIPDEGSDKEPETIGVVSLKKEASDFAHNCIRGTEEAVSLESWKVVGFTIYGHFGA